MKDTTYGDALRTQFRDPEAYLYQFLNVLVAAIRTFGWWLSVTVILSGGFLLFNFPSQDLGRCSSIDCLADFQYFVESLTQATGAIALIVCVIANLGRFRNVFAARAWNEVYGRGARTAQHLSANDCSREEPTEKNLSPARGREE